MNEIGLRRWCGYAAFASGLLLIIASLTLLVSSWAADDLALVTSLLLIFAKFLLVPILIGIFLYGDSTRGFWLTGFLVAVLGVQFELADFYPPLGTVTLLIGLVFMAVSVSPNAPKMQLGLWGWIGANILAFVSGILGLGLMLVAAVFIAGCARLLIGTVLLQPESANEPDQSG